MSPEAPVSTVWQRHAIRGDIQGLRAVAVLLVLVFHVWPTLLPGGYIGVDVFFVISGYLIVGSLVRELERDGRVSLLDFYRRRARRLMPAALAVLGAVLVGTVLLLPQARWEDTLRQVISSALYVQNWYLSWTSVDYLAAENAPSPVLHYWSLSIEEQFYILWPLVMLVAGLFIARSKLPVRTVVGYILLAVLALSFLASLLVTADSPAQAYFVSHTRFWEIAFGGLIATWLPRTELASGSRAALFLIGIGLILVAAFTYGGVAFPGWVALLPVLGTGLVLVAGSFNVGAFSGVDTRPFRYVGDISYSLYLWHWPIIVFYGAAVGEIGALSGVGIILATLLVSHLSYRHIEERFRHRKVTLQLGPLATGFTGAAFVTAASLMLFVGIMSSAAPKDPGTHLELNGYPGPAALLTGAEVPDGIRAIPAPAHLLRDRSVVYDSGCHQDVRSAEVLTCTLGAPDGSFTVALIGSSHSVNWLPAIDAIARKNDWRVVSITKSACGFGIDRPEACAQWHDGVVDYLRENQPGLVIVAESTDQDFSSGAQELVAARLARIGRLGVPIIAIRPTPRLLKDPGDCLPDRLAECEIPLDSALGPNAFSLAEMRVANLHVIDMTDAICSPSTCNAVVGNIVVFRDRHHLTATYARALAPYLEQRIARLEPMPAPINSDPWQNTAGHPAAADQGVILRCGGFRSGSRPFARIYQVELENGQISLKRGDFKNRDRNFELWSGEIKDEVVKISGTYREGSGGTKSLAFVGTVIDGVLVAGGKRGPRNCSVYWAPPDESVLN